jgi:hypothetical protein
MMTVEPGLLSNLLQNNAEHPPMTGGGWGFMIGAWILILWLTFFTFSRILRGKR